MHRTSIALLLCLAAKAATTEELMSFNTVITNEWFDTNNCSFYQSTVDTVFICNDSEIYLISRDAPFNETPQLNNVYKPDSFGLNLVGKIERVMP